MPKPKPTLVAEVKANQRRPTQNPEPELHDDNEENNNENNSNQGEQNEPEEHLGRGIPLNLVEVLAQLGAGIAALQQAQIKRIEPAPRSKKSQIKIEVPTFNGQKDDDLDQWLTRMEFVIKVKELEDPETVVIAITGLGKEPAQWYHARQQEEEDALGTWDDFKKEISIAFGHPMAYDHYYNKIIGIKQVGPSIQAYNSEFSCLAAKMEGMPDCEKMILYIRGLRIQTQVEVKCKQPKTWLEAKEYATIIETIKSSVYADRTAAREVTQKPQSKGQAFGQRNRSRFSGSRSSQEKETTDDARSTRSSNSTKEKDKEKPKKLGEWTEGGQPICNKCKKPGHMRRDCRVATPTEATSGN